MKYVIWLLVAALLIAHQDSWYWTDDTLVYGFLPIGLFYHACLSVAASVVWLIACTIAWPKELDGIDGNDDSETTQTEAN
jgi:hypothetical protein